MSYNPSASAGKRSASEESSDEEPVAFQQFGAGPSSKRLKPATDISGMYSEQAQRMMQRMQYDRTKGLGKSSQGLLEPVTVAAQKGRLGLGMQLEGLDSAAATWDSDMEKLQIPEKVDWLENDDPDDVPGIEGDTLEGWLKHGQRKLTIDDETQFCNEEILRQVLECKSTFDKLDARDMRAARTRSNPFETIKSNIFMNRAAVKMANMDAMFDCMFTNPVDEADEPLVRDHDLLYFADVCAGPGGFSEYILWRKGWTAKGFGFTLRNENDFKLSDFIAGTPETFDPFYGPNNDGNIFDPTNITEFTDYVMKQTTSGVHIMMADGGFSVDGQENIQEILSKQLYLCQMLVALNIVRTNGHFVVKLFDLFTPFSVGLIYLMYKCFKRISICKPNTSRPANSERYLVCKWKKAGVETIARHLYEVNEWLNDKKDDQDVTELVPYDVIESDEKFMQYVKDSNNEIGANQINALKKIAAFCNDRTKVETRQTNVKEQCLALWKLTDGIRKHLKAPVSADLRSILKDWDEEFLTRPATLLNKYPIKSVFPSILGWHFVPLSNAEGDDINIRSFFLGRGGKDVQHLDKRGSWVALNRVHLELSPKTLVYAELVQEFIGTGGSQRTTKAFHIIDGIMLGGVDIRKYTLKERLKMCDKYARALNKPCRTVEISQNSYSTTVPVRCKKSFSLTDFEAYFDTLDEYKMKDRTTRLGYKVRDLTEPDRFCVPKGLLLLNETRNDFLKMYSKSQRKVYFFNTQQNTSHFPDQMQSVVETVASFRNSFQYRILWEWLNPAQVLETVPANARQEGLVYREDVTNFVHTKLPQ